MTEHSDGFLQEARALADAFEQREGRRPRLYLAGSAPDDGTHARTMAASVFSEGGWDVDVGPEEDSAESAVRNAADNDVHVIGLFLREKRGQAYVSALEKALEKARRRDILLFVFGAGADGNAPWHEAPGDCAAAGTAEGLRRGCLRLLRHLAGGAEKSREGQEQRMNDNHDDLRPSWVPEEKSPEFACTVMRGIDTAANSVTGDKEYPEAPLKRAPLRRKLSVQDYIDGVSQGDRMILSRAITLIESNAPRDFARAQQMLQGLLPRTGRALRIGITGVPGAGKSTFIEAFGQMLCRQGYHVAVLAVDPTSSITGGSVLGDKTRMQKLSREPNCFIRPSPSKGTLGGVTRKSRETMLLCEAAGCDVILVETVGVGQSETTVRSMVDFFLLVVLTGAGDELQGIKRGIMELADAIVVNKADGDNLARATVTQGEYERMAEFIRPATEGWRTHAYKCSALQKTGLLELWAVMRKFEELTKKSGVFQNRRQRQVLDWMNSMIDEHLHNLFFEDPLIREQLPTIRAAVLAGAASPSQAVTELIRAFDMDRASARHLEENSRS